MTRVKSRYKQFATGGAVQAEAPIAPSVVMSIDTDAAPQSHSDDASVALQRQIDALRHSEQLQREQSEHAAQVARVGDLIGQNQDMMQNPTLLQQAANEVEREGHNLPLHSEEFFHKVRQNFEGKMRQLNEPDVYPPSEPTPKFFEPPEPRSPSRASMFSAPVSRSIPGSSPEAGEVASGRASSRVTLSAQEKEIARASGVSELDYALGKLELQKRKASGHYDR